MALRRFCDNCDREIVEKQIATMGDGSTQLSAKIGKYKEIVTVSFSVFTPGSGTTKDMCVDCVAEAISRVSEVPQKASFAPVKKDGGF